MRDLCTHTSDVGLSSVSGGGLVVAVPEDGDKERTLQWWASQEASWVGRLDPDLCHQRLWGNEGGYGFFVGPASETGIGGNRQEPAAAASACASAGAGGSNAPPAAAAFRGWVHVSTRLLSDAGRNGEGDSNSPPPSPRKKKGKNKHQADGGGSGGGSSVVQNNGEGGAAGHDSEGHPTGGVGGGGQG